MKYTEQEFELIVDTIGKISVYHPEIDTHIDRVLSGEEPKITSGSVKRFRDLVLAYVDFPKRITSTFMAFCIASFFKTKKIFAKDVRKSITKFEKNKSIKL